MVIVIGGGDSALYAAVMALQRGASVNVNVRQDVPIGKADTRSHIRELGGIVHTSAEIQSAADTSDGSIAVVLNNGSEIRRENAVAQIGFLSAMWTFEGLALRLTSNGSVAIDPYFETSRCRIFAVGNVNGNIKRIAVV